MPDSIHFGLLAGHYSDCTGRNPNYVLVDEPEANVLAKHAASVGVHGTLRVKAQKLSAIHTANAIPAR